MVAQSKKLVEALHTADVDVELHVADEAALGSEATYLSDRSLVLVMTAA